MSLLGSDGIRAAIDAGNIVVIHPDGREPKIGPNSIDLHLHDELKAYSVGPFEPIDPMDPPYTFDVARRDGGGWILEPGRLYLGRTAEWTETRDLVPDCSGRSSIGRLGISVHITAGWGDIGFRGFWTLEIACVQRVVLYPWMRIAQVRYSTVSGQGHTYDGRYQGSLETTPSLYHRGEK